MSVDEDLINSILKDKTKTATQKQFCYSLIQQTMAQIFDTWLH